MPRKKDKPLICKHCKKTYYVTTYESKRSMYCSHKCRADFWKAERIKLICEYCGKIYYHPPSIAKNSKYCSSKCQHIMVARKQPVGINSKNFKTGIRRYRDVAKRHVIAKCFICKATNNLIVHHLDKNRHNNKISNLAFVCRSCHQRLHMVIKNIKWMQPYFLKRVGLPPEATKAKNLR